MAKKQIPCGGFYYDDTQFEFVDGELKSKGNSGGFDVEFTVLYEYSSALGYRYELVNTKGDYDSIVEKSQNHLPLSSNCAEQQKNSLDVIPLYVDNVGFYNVMTDHGYIKFHCRVITSGSSTMFTIILHSDNTWELEA